MRKGFIENRLLEKSGYYTASSMWNAKKEWPLMVKGRTIQERLNNYFVSC